MQRPKIQPRYRRSSGFTLLELLVVGMLGILVVKMSTDAAKWYVHSVSEINISVQLNKQMKLAAEMIAQDAGGALAQRTNTGDDLEFNIDAGDSTAQWTAPDTVVHYSINNGLLIRHDLLADEEVVVARNITAFTVTDDGTYLDVHLVAGFREEQQDIHLHLEGS